MNIVNYLYLKYTHSALINQGVKLFLAVLIISAGYMYFAPEADAVWYSSSWGYRRQITLDYTKVGTTTPITGFPLMFSTSTIADLKFTGSGGKVGKSDGTDILITASDGTTKLPHEIEYYSSSTGQTILWFKSSASTPLSTTTNTTYYIYYGNSGASDQQDVTNVWDSNYKMVLHLGTPSSLVTTDSTSNANNVSTNSGVVAGTGKIGGAGNFDELDYLVVTDHATLDFSSAMTYSAWVKLSSGQSYAKLLTKGNNSTYTMFGQLITDTKPQMNFWLTPSGGGGTQSPTAIYDNNWHYVVGTFDGSNAVTAVDGSSTSGSLSGTIATDASDVYINRDSTGAFNSNTGLHDEVRLSSVARSASWIKTEYNNQNSPNTFWSVGAEETDTPAAGDAPGTVYQKGDFRMTGYVNIGHNTSLSCTGGTITSSGGKTIHTFTSSGTFSCNGIGLANVLVVGGGGGGGGSRGGGGGAGGYISNPSLSLIPGDYTVTVGNGGGPETNGSDSVFGVLTAIGGGAGKQAAGNNGGSGGGGGPLSAGGSGTTGQGNAGAASGGTLSGAGGGGASAVGGLVVNNNIGGNGGDGTANSISGASVTYAGGGGGASNIGTPTTGGAGGGGAGNNGTGGNGTANTGGGGGGGASTGGSGGSGIVIISY